MAVEQVRRHRQVVAAVGGPRRPPAAPPRLQAHLAHQPLDPPARVAPTLPAQLGVDPPRAVGAPAGGEDAADQAAQLGLRLGPGAGDRDRAQPGVEAGDARADHPAQRGHGVVRPLGGDEGEPAHAIPRAKKAAAFLRISTSSSSRLFSRFSRCSSACSALRAASASAEPAARCSLRHAAQLAGAQPQLGRDLAQPLAALEQPLDRLGLELGGEPPPGLAFSAILPSSS